VSKEKLWSGVIPSASKVAGKLLMDHPKLIE